MKLQQGFLLNGGNYRIESVLGQGGFGITYKAVQVALNRTVAIKEFYVDDYCERDVSGFVSVPSTGGKKRVDEYLKKFIKEAKHIALLEHKHIVPLIDIFEENGTAYYVMKYYGNGSLFDKINRCGPLPEETSLRYIRQLSSALKYVHSRKIMHLDIKPGNIMLDDDDNAILIDFGLSKHYDGSGHQTTRSVPGTSKGYAPLEQYKDGGVGYFSPSTDIYSLAATLYKILTGITPPEASDLMNFGLPEFSVDVSPDIRNAIKVAMSPMQEGRPQSVDEFLSMLEGKSGKQLSENTRRQDSPSVSTDEEVTKLKESDVKKSFGAKASIEYDKHRPIGNGEETIPLKNFEAYDNVNDSKQRKKSITIENRSEDTKKEDRLRSVIIGFVLLFLGNILSWDITPFDAYEEIDSDGRFLVFIFVCLAIMVVSILTAINKQRLKIARYILLFLSMVNIALLPIWNISLIGSYSILSHILFSITSLSYFIKGKEAKNGKK